MWTKIGLLLGLVFLTIPPYGEPQKATLCNGIRSEFTHTREGGRRGRVKNHLKVSLYFAIYFACSLTQSVSWRKQYSFRYLFQLSQSSSQGHPNAFLYDGAKSTYGQYRKDYRK